MWKYTSTTNLRKLDMLLKDGWEPFTVTTTFDTRFNLERLYNTYHLRKQTQHPGVVD